MLGMIGTPLFVVAVAAMFAKMHFVKQGDLRKLKYALWTSLVSCALLAVCSAVSLFTGGGFVSALLTGLWGWMAYRDYKQIF